MKKTAKASRPEPQGAASTVESMTGFGEARAKFGTLTLACRIRSLNHRFLDVKLRLPRNDMLSLDMATRKLLAESFKRGSVELTINTETLKDSADNLVNVKLAKTYFAAARELSKQLGGKATDLTLDALLRMPGVVGSSNGDETLLDLKDEDVLEKLVRPAIAALKTARKSEGQKLAAHILEMIRQMQNHLKELAALEGPEKERSRQHMIDRASETLKLLKTISSSQNTDEFSSRLREEAVFWIERRDFEEERMRLGMHLKTFHELLSNAQEVSGRKLEFIQQEILREINTLGTKAHSPAITAHTVELKTILERVREQLANVE